jgi:2C-methyl-D-erythritol 2,4-cyclodiphosphate synthase
LLDHRLDLHLTLTLTAQCIIIGGEKKADAVFAAFQTAMNGAGAMTLGRINADDFEAYYGGISSSSPLTDDAFIGMMERLWAIKEVDVVPDANEQWLLQVRAAIREKCRVKVLPYVNTWHDMT